MTASRDTAGLATAYAYDSMGRLASISPPGAASTSFAYRAALGSDPARVTSTTAGTTTVEQTYDYDGLGRLFREKRRMPDGSWALRKTDYRGAGATKFVSEWVALASGADENLVVPAIGTAFEQDQFGRTTKLITPDQKTVSTTYVNAGVREVRRTRTVATPSSGSTSVTVAETYDLHGNLTGVSEPSGPTSATGPLAGNVRTDYVYDAANRLVRVTMNPPAAPEVPQVRQFTYDARGLLLSESHPEKELPVTYGSYDARGHAWTSTDADVPLTFQYDTAERLVQVSNAAGSALKEYAFGTAGDCAYCNGKLRKATRHNSVSGGGDHTVAETYSYGANGLPSSRETLVERPGYTMQKFTQELRYDELLQLDRIDFPACLLPGCSTAGGLSTVDHTRTRGLLTQIAGYGSIGYHPSGMISEVRHETTSPRTDAYESDQGMARPAKITFGGTTTCAAPDAPIITAAASVCSGSAGNQASVANVQSGVTYTWTIQNGTLASSSGTTVSYTAGTTGQVALTATAQNTCSSTGSAAKTVAIARPTATVSGSATIAPGGSPFVDVALTGTPPWSVTWSDGTVNSNIAASPLRRQVSPAVTTTYQLTAASDASSCTVVRSGSATITVGSASPASPASLTATATDLSVQLTWPAVSVAGGARYDVERAANVNGPFAQIATAIAQTSWIDTAPAGANGLPVAYVYRVLTVAPDGTRSAVQTSPRDYAVTAAAMYPGGTITAGATGIRAQYIVELRRGIDALRKLANLPEAFASLPAPAGLIMAGHFAGLLAPLDAARAPFGYSAFVYANGLARPATGVSIKAAHITELREVLK